MNSLDWVELVRIDSSWIDDLLIRHKPTDSTTGKIRIRAFSIKFCGTEENMQALIEFMADNLTKYVLSDQEIIELKKKGKEPYLRALKYFGAIDPTKDGKFGELLLFLFVEAILQTPMIAHKIKSLSDVKHQINGSDGVFYGKYQGCDSLLLGESKVYQKRYDAIDDALQSVDKFHNSTSFPEMKTELNIIRQTLSKDLSEEHLDFLLKILDVDSAEYRTTNKVHPILIVYDEKKIEQIEQNCTSSDEGEQMTREKFETLSAGLLNTIDGILNNKWKSCKKIHLDFFFLPITDVTKFKKAAYSQIHQV